MVHPQPNKPHLFGYTRDFSFETLVHSCLVWSLPQFYTAYGKELRQGEPSTRKHDLVLCSESLQIERVVQGANIFLRNDSIIADLKVPSWASGLMCVDST